jgi:BASS family bile acid:Na+ symporter
MKIEDVIRVLTISSLSGLLLGVGLRLTVAEVWAALRQCRLLLIVLVNFVVVPLVVVAAIRIFGIGHELAVGMILLAAAPFAPVVPVFARMARADLALAVGLTSLFPILAAFLTPWVCEIALNLVSESGAMRFSAGRTLLILVATITLPLGTGLSLNHFASAIARRWLRPVEIASEIAGALSLAFVTATEIPSMLVAGWKPLLVMALVSELSLGLGLAMGGPERGARQVVGLGTSNRNIALALLVAIQNFGGTAVVGAVAENGLLLILLGLLHVACWRFGPVRSVPA